MTVMLEMPKEIEAQMLADAEARGVPLSDYVREFILEHYREDAEDLHTASERLSDPQGSLTPRQLRERLDLDS